MTRRHANKVPLILCVGERMNLKDVLKDWEDFDGASHELAIALGIIPIDSDFIEHKWLYWTNNELGIFLHETLKRMYELGILEFDEEEFRFKWNQVDLKKFTKP